MKVDENLDKRIPKLGMEVNEKFEKGR